MQLTQRQKDEQLVGRFRIVALELQRRYTQARGPILIGGVLSLLIIGAIVVLGLTRQIAFSTLVRDIFALTGRPVYLGLLSNLGILAWTVGAVSWLMGAAMLRGRPAQAELFRLTLVLGLLTTLMVLDDGLMIHEYLFPRFTGLPEQLFLAIYPLGLVVATVAGGRSVVRTPYPIGLIAGSLLAGSLLVDWILPVSDVQLLVEDGMKFAGIVFWAVYACSTALQLAEQPTRPRS
ncbi:MAG: hypothetical protein OHK0015_01360 [Chloroflexi bacterium OHK40]